MYINKFMLRTCLFSPGVGGGTVISGVQASRLSVPSLQGGMFGAVCRQHKAWSHLCQPPLVKVTPVSLATWDAANRQWFLMACLPRNMTSVTFKNIFELDRRAIKMPALPAHMIV